MPVVSKLGVQGRVSFTTLHHSGPLNRLDWFSMSKGPMIALVYFPAYGNINLDPEDCFFYNPVVLRAHLESQEVFLVSSPRQPHQGDAPIRAGLAANQLGRTGARTGKGLLFSNLFLGGDAPDGWGFNTLFVYSLLVQTGGVVRLCC